MCRAEAERAGVLDGRYLQAHTVHREKFGRYKDAPFDCYTQLMRGEI